jgi:hypothetical protein
LLKKRQLKLTADFVSFAKRSPPATPSRFPSIALPRLSVKPIALIVKRPLALTISLPEGTMVIVRVDALYLTEATLNKTSSLVPNLLSLPAELMI